MTMPKMTASYSLAPTTQHYVSLSFSKRENSTNSITPQMVNRLLPGVTQPAWQEQWNYEVGSLGEQQYNQTKRLIRSLDGLKDYVNDNELEASPVVQPDTCESIFNKYGPKYEVNSDYHRAGRQLAKDLYLQACAAGYNPLMNGVRSRLDNIISQYLSLTYESDVTRTGILLR